MKTLLMVLVVVCLCSSCPAQTTSDLSMTLRPMTGQDPILIPWYIYSNDYFVEGRYNFDALKGTSLFAGKTVFTKDELVITPAIGLIVGPNYHGVSPEVYALGTVNNISYIMLNQYSIGTGSNPDFLYHWVEVLYGIKIKNDQYSIGISEQIFRDYGISESSVDVGPVIKCVFENTLYLKIWPTWSPTQPNIKKAFIMFGMIF